MENKESVEQEEAQKEESIFSTDEFSMEGYDKHIRHARNAIFFVVGVLVINLIILTATYPLGYEYLWIDLSIWGLFIAGFIFLGLHTKKKPYNAIVGALCLYGIFIALNAYFDVSTLYKGILFKIIVIVMLINGLNDAKATQEMQKNFSAQ